MQIGIKALLGHVRLPGDAGGRLRGRAIEPQRFGIFLHDGRRRSVRASAAGDLSFTLLPDGLFPNSDASGYEFLVIEEQMLLQSRTGDPARLGGFPYRDVTVRSQQFDCIGILLPTTASAPARQTVVVA